MEARLSIKAVIAQFPIKARSRLAVGRDMAVVVSFVKT
jgi:hypothetical protein